MMSMKICIFSKKKTFFGEKHKNQQIYDYFSKFKNTCAINFF